MTVNATCPECGEQLLCRWCGSGAGHRPGPGARLRLESWLTCDACGLSWSEDELDAIYVEREQAACGAPEPTGLAPLTFCVTCGGVAGWYCIDPQHDHSETQNAASLTALRRIGDALDVEVAEAYPSVVTAEAGAMTLADAHSVAGKATVTVPKAEWDALVDVVERHTPDRWDGATYAWSFEVTDAAHALVKAARR